MGMHLLNQVVCDFNLFAVAVEVDAVETSVQGIVDDIQFDVSARKVDCITDTLIDGIVTHHSVFIGIFKVQTKVAMVQSVVYDSGIV